MQPLLTLAMMLIVAILLLVLATAILNAAKVGEPWRTVILAILLLGVVVFAARQLGLW